MSSSSSSSNICQYTSNIGYKSILQWTILHFQDILKCGYHLSFATNLLFCENVRCTMYIQVTKVRHRTLQLNIYTPNEICPYIVQITVVANGKSYSQTRHIDTNNWYIDVEKKLNADGSLVIHLEYIKYISEHIIGQYGNDTNDIA